ncbi:DUF3806 domain-containing protein [Terrabacter sp. MAHUQ-38]|uniref:DUF3806 domain-containing protein n=1 Tax=unclassified Terrabacter TaxID=2630222 RepID=UPI00165DF687|nr:DUF3806 domain-containing protein [Terrabacter sp. MAHUQ-38]MBC9822659.1 DUF3806 domain-containing protein [Terrabacter sp. MAHUQ-38]
MGLFSKKNKDDAAPPSEPASVDPVDDGGDTLGPDHTGRPVANPLGDAERDRIATALAHAADEGVDVDDLDSIGAHYDEALRQWSAGGNGDGPDVIVDTFAVAIGEHLARHSAREWAVVTDVFGTDLGLVAARADTVVVPHNLVGARWMRGETGWIPGVVEHLVRIRPRPS